MPKIQLPIAKGFYVSDALPISNQQCVNFYPNVPQSDTVTPDNLFNTPGLNQLAIVSDIDVCRGAHIMAGIPYFVIGNSLIRLNRTFDAQNNEVFTTDDLGIIAGNQRVWMADNGTQLCIVAVPDNDTLGVSYIFVEPATLAIITDVDFDGPAASVVYVDGFFVFHKSDGKKFFNSAILDGLTYDAADFSQATADPDQIRALAVYKNQLAVIGSETTEIFRNTGRSPAPFVRIQGAIIDIGITSPNSATLLNGDLVFVGAAVNESPAVWLIRGGTNKQKISTTAIDNELSKLTDSQIQGIFSVTYAESGAYFLGIAIPGGSTSFWYDSVNQRWHERQSIKGTSLTTYRVADMITGYGRVLVGDLQKGIIGEIREDIFTEYGFLMRRFVTSKPFDDLGNPVRLAGLEALVENGVGLTADVTVESGTTMLGVPIEVSGGSDPKITLSWSDDGGRTFVGDRSRSMGKIGEFNHRSIWRRLGRFPRSRVIKLEVTSPTKATIIKLEADIA